MTKPIGIMLTIAGLVLAMWFARQAMEPGPAQLTAFIVAAIALAMMSVGIRYILRGAKADDIKRAAKKAEMAAKKAAKLAKTQQGPTT